MLNHKHTEESKQLMREKALGRKHTNKSKALMRAIALARFKNGMPETTKDKISLAITALWQDPIYRKKTIAGQTGTKHKFARRTRRG